MNIREVSRKCVHLFCDDCGYQIGSVTEYVDWFPSAIDQIGNVFGLSSELTYDEAKNAVIKWHKSMHRRHEKE